jgi:hypothetical protein
MAEDGTTYKVNFTDILSSDPLTAKAQTSIANGNTIEFITPEEVTTPEEVSEEMINEVAPEATSQAEGVKVTIDGREGTIVGKSEDGSQYAVSFENNGVEDTEIYTKEEIDAAMATMATPKTESTITKVDVTESGKVDVDKLPAPDAAKDIVNKAGSIEAAIEGVKEVMAGVAEERKTASKAQKKRSLNDIGKTSEEVQALDAQLAHHGEVLAELEKMLTEQKAKISEAKETVPSEITEKSATEAQSESVGLIRNEAAMKMTDKVLELVDDIGKKLGVTIEFVENLTNAQGQRVNGDIVGKKVRISTTGSRGVRFIIGHEFFHRVKDIVTPEQYAEFVKTVKDFFSDDVWNGILESHRNTYRQHNARVVTQALADKTDEYIIETAQSLGIDTSKVAPEDLVRAIIKVAVDKVVTRPESGVEITDETSSQPTPYLPELLKLTETLCEEESVADVAGEMIQNHSLFANYADSISDKIWLLRVLRKAIRGLKEFLKSKDYTTEHKKLNAMENALTQLFAEAEISEAESQEIERVEGEKRDAVTTDRGRHSLIGKVGVSALDKAQEADIAMKEAGVSESTERLREQGAIVDAERGDVRYSIADILTGDQREQAIADLMRVTGRSRRTVINYLKAEESLANIILSGDNKAFLDIQVDESVPSIWSNSDYPQGTVEFSNICRKRLPFTMIYQRLQKDFPNTVFDASSLESIRQTLIANGEEVACGLCFVEDRRQLLGEIGQGFIKALKGETIELNDKQQEAIARMRESGDTYIPNLYELITLDGMKILRKEHPEIANAFVAYNNARGMQAGRLFQAYSAYHRDILNYDAKKVAKINNAGGLRIFSFSDFEAHHLIDLVQVLTDCAAKGIKVQGYTKVPQFANAVKDTKMKVNRSLIAKGKGVVDADYIPQEGEAVSPNIIDGKRLLFDTVEGINVNSPDFFDSTDSKNVGNILVGINDEHIRIAMLDPFVDYIIGFHTGLSESIREQKGISDWTNYKYTQLEKILKDGKLVNADKHGINIYTEVLTPEIKTERQFVREYLKVCEEKGWIPKYHRFLDKSKSGKFIYTKGYYKLLLDFKMFDKNGKILPQEVVVPVFDNEVNKQILEDYVADEKAKAPNDELYGKVVDAMVERGVLTEAQVGESMGARYSMSSPEETAYSNVRYSIQETDPVILDALNNGATMKVYRAMQVIDGELYPPMSAKVDGKLRNPIKIGVWERAEERPDLADEKGNFKLDKGNNTSLKARYNPYIHTSLTPLNDQFSSAQDRPNLVTVEVEVPVSELTSGYKAEKAKDAVGKLEWKAGVVQGQLTGTRTVILSRWDRPIRIVPDSEVAQRIVEMFGDTKVVMPSNVVTPSLRTELEKLGVPFKETTNQGKPIEGLGDVKVSQKGNSVFGPVYEGFTGRPKEAARFLSKKENGEAKGVFYLPDYGEISLVWGNNGGGLYHINKKHIIEGRSFKSLDEAIETIDNAVKRGKIIFENGDKIVLEEGDNLVTIRRNYRERGKKIADKNWVLSAYDTTAGDDTSAISGINKGQAAQTPAEIEGKDTISSAKKQANKHKFSLITPEMDASYLDAVERGDMATAQRMVMEAAKLAMPNTKVVDEDGNPKIVYHQTNASVYINRETGQNWDELDWRERMEWDERDDWDDYWEEREFNTFSRVNARTTQEFDGFFFAPEYDEYHEYGDRTIEAFLNIENPASRGDYNIDSSKTNAGRDERIRLQNEGYDGVIREEDGTIWEYVAFNPNQIKSADPVTYDDNGNVIPLSERFNPKKEDIRYSLIGEKGVISLENNNPAGARLRDLNIARQMEKRGEDALNIKVATGWERGVDGLWRYEIDDMVTVSNVNKLYEHNGDKAQHLVRRANEEKSIVQAMYDGIFNINEEVRNSPSRTYEERIRSIYNRYKDANKMELLNTINDLSGKINALKNGGSAFSLEDVIGRNHPIFAAYPEMRSVGVITTKYNGGSTRGSYNWIDNTITISIYTGNIEDEVETLVHEMQHAIQHIEGFATGGMVGGLNPHAEAKKKALIDEYTKKNEDVKKRKSELEARNVEIAKALNEWKNTRQEGSETPADIQSMINEESANKNAISDLRSESRRLERNIDELRGMNTLYSYDDYFRIAGEVEARTVAKRNRYTSEQRRNTLAVDDSDVAPEHRILVHKGDIMSPKYSVMAPTNEGGIKPEGDAHFSLMDDVQAATEIVSRYQLPDPDPSEAFYDELPVFDENGNMVDVTTLPSGVAQDILDSKVRQMLEAEYDHNTQVIRREAQQSRDAINARYRNEKNKRRNGHNAARTNTARIDEIFGDTPFESLPLEVQALILIATGQAKIYWGDKGAKRGLASELGLNGSIGDRHAYRNIWDGAKKSFNEVVHDWWESIGGQESGIDDNDLRNALISALQSVQSSKDAMHELINNYDDLTIDRDRNLANVDHYEAQELRKAKDAYEQYSAAFELSQGEERKSYHDRAVQYFGNQSLSRVDDILEELTNDIERHKRKIERLKAEKKDMYTPLAEGIAKSKEIILHALERIRMFAGMEEVDLNDATRLINMVKSARSQRQVDNLSSQAQALVQRISIKKAKTNLGRLLSLKLSNPDIIRKVLANTENWPEQERTSMLKHLWKVSRNGLRVSKAVHPDTRVIVTELKSLTDRYRKGDDVERGKILHEMEVRLDPNIEDIDKNKEFEDYADKNKQTAFELFRRYKELLDSEVAYKMSSSKVAKQRAEGVKGSALAESMADKQVKGNEYLQQLQLFNQELESLIVNGKEEISAFYLNKENHAKEIRSMGINAVGNIRARLLPDVNPKGKTKIKAGLKKANAVKNATINAPYWTFDTVLAKIDKAGKSGKLYTYFMNQFTDSVDVFYERERKHANLLADAMEEFFPKMNGKLRNKHNLFTRVMRKADDTLLPTTLSYLNNDNRRETLRLTISSGMYTIAMWRQPRYQESMRVHGITDAVIDNIYREISEVDAGYISLMDWVNFTLLPDTRLEYDQVYRALYGGSMAKEVNYFPAKVLHFEEVKLDEKTGLGTLSMSPSALKERTSVNGMPNLNMNYFKVLQGHLQNMDQWASFAQMREDLSTLLSSKEFKNRLNELQPGLKAEGGGEGGLFNNLFRTSKIATGLFEVDYNKATEIFSKAQQKWASANIAYRFWTAAKQLASIPIFAFYKAHDPMSYVFFAKALGRGLNPFGAVKRAMNLSPSLRHRWESKFAGLDVLMQETSKDDGIAKYRGLTKRTWDAITDFVGKVTKLGMGANAAVDIMACAVGVNMIYDYEIYKATGGKREATEEEKRDAIRKAEYAFNSTQQSSEGAYMSAIQMSPAASMYTVYMNASMAAHRKRSYGLEELWKSFTSKEYKQFITDEFGRLGLWKKRGEMISDLLQGIISDTAFVFMGSYGGLLGMSLLFDRNDDDDDDDKEEYWRSFKIDAALSMLNGYLFGGLVSSGIKKGEFVFNPALDELSEDIKKLLDDKGNWVVETAQIVTQFGIGVDLKTFYNIVAGVQNALFEEEDGDYSGAFLKILNAPTGYIKAFVGDRREGESVEEYMLRIVRLHTHLANIEYKDVFDENGKPILEDFYSPSMSQKQLNELRKEAENAYRRNILIRKGGLDVYKSYMEAEKVHKDICDLIGYDPYSKPSKEKQEKSDVAWEMAYYQEDVAYAVKERTEWFGDEEEYYNLLKDEQKAMNEFINAYYEYIKQSGFGAN